MVEHLRRRQRLKQTPPMLLAPVQLTAVCLAGSLRSFMKPVVQNAFVAHVHQPGYEYYLSTDTPRPPDSSVLVAPIRAWVVSGTVWEINWRGTGPRGKCPNATCHPKRMLSPMVERLAECYYSMQKEEGERHMRYSFLVRLRPDHLFTKPLPHPERAMQDASKGPWAVEGHPVLLYDDQIAMSVRQDAPSVLLTPKTAYDVCADDEMWRRACSAYGVSESWTVESCREQRNSVPCTEMALITVLGAARSWRSLDMHPWLITPKRWNASGIEDEGYFCLMRDNFVEDPDGPKHCLGDSGCMSC